MTIYERGETYTHWSTIRDNDGVKVAPTDITISIYDPCDIQVVTSQSMTSDSTGVYYYNHTLNSSATYGRYKTKVEVDGGGGLTSYKEDEFFVMPWKVEDDVRRKIGIDDSADISDSDLSHLCWSSYKQALREIHYHKREVPNGDPDTGNKWNGSNFDFQTKNYPIADINGDGSVSGNTTECTQDIDTWWIDEDGSRQEGLVTITNSDNGEINITQSGGTAIPSTARKVYVDYWVEPTNYDEFIFREAVGYLAAHYVSVRLQNREKITVADINNNEKIITQNPYRFIREYRRLLRLINKAKIGGA